MANDVHELRHTTRAVVRPAVPSDYEGIKRVWKAAFGESIFGGERTYDRYLAWAFDRNPHRYPENVSRLVTELDGKVVAAWCATPVKLLVRGQIVPSGWTQNLAVAPEARGLGLARKMFKRLPGRHLLLGSGCVDASRPLVESEGVHFVRADRFVTLRTSLRHAARSVLRDVYHRDPRSAWAGLRSLGRRVRVPLGSHAGIDVVETKRFDAALDTFFAEVARAIPVMTQRSAERLDWTLDNPLIESVAFVAKRGDAPCGYAIVRRDGMLLELLVHPDDPAAFAAVLARVVAWAGREGIREVGGIVPGLPSLAAMYEAAGFLPVDDVDFGTFYAFPDIERTDATLSDPRNWYLSLADSDLFSFRWTGSAS